MFKKKVLYEYIHKIVAQKFSKQSKNFIKENIKM